MANVLKNFFRNPITFHNLKLVRNIMQSSARSEKVIEDLKQNPYYEKYAKKIATLQQTSPEEFLSRIDASEKAKLKPKLGETKERQFTSLLSPKDKVAPVEKSQEKQLKDIMKLDLIQDKDSSEIKQIWEQYHIMKDVIAATIPTDLYDEIFTQSKKYPMFIFPLPRSQGYEFMVCQFSNNTVHFTPLICYQVHKENAPECLTMVHYTELKDSKKIVLMRGEYDKDVLDAMEAQCLANQLQMYYGKRDQKKLDLLDTFTHKPDDFKHMDLIAQLESITI